MTRYNQDNLYKIREYFMIIQLPIDLIRYTIRDNNVLVFWYKTLVNNKFKYFERRISLIDFMFVDKQHDWINTNIIYDINKDIFFIE